MDGPLCRVRSCSLAFGIVQYYLSHKSILLVEKGSQEGAIIENVEVANEPVFPSFVGGGVTELPSDHRLARSPEVSATQQEMGHLVPKEQK